MNPDKSAQGILGPDGEGGPGRHGDLRPDQGEAGELLDFWGMRKKGNDQPEKRCVRPAEDAGVRSPASRESRVGAGRKSQL